MLSFSNKLSPPTQWQKIEVTDGNSRILNIEGHSNDYVCILDD